MGYFLQSARRDYIIFDKNSTIGYYPVATKYLPIIHSLYTWGHSSLTIQGTVL